MSHQPGPSHRLTPPLESDVDLEMEFSDSDSSDGMPALVTPTPPPDMPIGENLALASATVNVRHLFECSELLLVLGSKQAVVSDNSALTVVQELTDKLYYLTDLQEQLIKRFTKVKIPTYFKRKATAVLDENVKRSRTQ